LKVKKKRNCLPSIINVLPDSPGDIDPHPRKNLGGKSNVSYIRSISAAVCKDEITVET
jgi:hypothetical protein